MVWSLETSRGNEAQKIAPFIVPYTRGRGLDIGCGPYSPFHHFLGIDEATDDGKPVAKLRQDGRDLSSFASGKWDFVFSSHFLEHVHDFEAVLAEWWRVIRPGGHLVLYLPHRNFYPNVGSYGSNPDHKHDFLPQDIRAAMTEIAVSSRHGWTQVEDEERNEDDEYSFFQVYRKHGVSHPDRKPACDYDPWRKRPNSCLVVRYGAIGDHMMTSSVLPKLREKGLHVTYNCDPRGEMLLRDDPHIDAFLVQDNDQVPNHLLGPYWNRLLERYDWVYNLSESIEGALLAVPGRMNHAWPDGTRRAVMGGVNYLDRTHDLCDVPHDPRPRFYPNKDEAHFTKREIAKARYGRAIPTAAQKRNPRLVILWCMAGSSRHKTWPHLDQCVLRLIGELPVTVVLTGDNLCKVLEVGLEGHERLWLRSGEWSIRQTLAFAQQADIVVGPETGVLNAVSMDEKVHKVIYLSHSSTENLTRDWKSTTVLLPDERVTCYPCHRLHYPGSPYCPQEPESHTALCAYSIPSQAMFEAIKHHADHLMGREAAE
jgi:ADP-heptose:LPS heptosyltransferase/predicted SAM-dependent methyltransferase